MIWMRISNPRDPDPKRGDLMRTNVGDRRERTWFILGARRMRCAERRFQIWRARWWELEPETRQALHRSAERHGGQECWELAADKPKRRSKRTFEDLMREGVRS